MNRRMSFYENHETTGCLLKRYCISAWFLKTPLLLSCLRMELEIFVICLDS